MRRTAIGLTAIVATIILAGGQAAADDLINLPLDTVVRGEEGDLIQLASVAVDPDLVGATCSGFAEADNQESVHPGNDVIISSGGNSAVIAGVEDTPGGIKTLSGQVVLGETVTASLRMGPDGVFSGGIIVRLDCDAVAETTTTIATTATTVAEPTTTLPETTTTVAVQNETTTTVAVQNEATTTAPTTAPTTTAPPSGGVDQGQSELPRTGSTDVAPLVLVALGLLGGGAALLITSRRLGTTD